jgi:HEAT repeat protein
VPKCSTYSWTRPKQKLLHTDSAVREIAIDTLVQLGVSDSVVDLIPLLRDPSRSVRIAVVRAIQSLRNYTLTVTHLETFLDVCPDANENEAGQVARALILRDTNGVVDVFLGALFKDSDIKIRLRGFLILRELDDIRALSYLATLTNDNDCAVQLSALHMMYQKLTNSKNIQELLRQLYISNLINKLSQ